MKGDVFFAMINLHTVQWKTKLMASFALIILVFLAASFLNGLQLQGMIGQLNRQNEKAQMKLTALELKVLIQELKDISSGLMISRNEEYAGKFSAKRQDFQDLVLQVGNTASTEEQQKWRSQLIMEQTEFLELFDRALAIIRSTDLGEIDIQKNTDSLYNETQQKRDRLFELVDRFYIAYAQEAEAAVQSTYAKTSFAGFILKLAAALTIFIAAAVSLLLIRSFLKPIRHMEQIMLGIEDGDLSRRIGSKSGDELGRLGRGFDQMMDRVAAMLIQVRSIGSQLNDHSTGFHNFARITASGNADILKAIREISSGADQQAGLTERSASLVSDMVEEVAGIARSADDMHRLSGMADHQAKAGSRAAGELGAAAERASGMLRQAESAVEAYVRDSGQVATIVRAIADIASQTQVLALNASIEAARAGQFGKGFLVIADQVRTLSDQTRQSAQAASALISSLQAKTTDMRAAMQASGEASRSQHALVEGTLQAFRTIEQAVAELSAQTARIQESVGQAEIRSVNLNEAVHHAAAITQETAAGVEEVNAAAIQQNEAVHRIAQQAEAMHSLVERLFEEAGRFQLSSPPAQRE